MPSLTQNPQGFVPLTGIEPAVFQIRKQHFLSYGNYYSEKGGTLIGSQLVSHSSLTNKDSITQTDQTPHRHFWFKMPR